MLSIYCDRPEPPPDHSAELKRIETQLQLMQIENTELVEKNNLAGSSMKQLQDRLSIVMQEKTTLHSTVNAVSSGETFSID